MEFRLAHLKKVRKISVKSFVNTSLKLKPLIKALLKWLPDIYQNDIKQSDCQHNFVPQVIYSFTDCHILYTAPLNIIMISAILKSVVLVYVLLGGFITINEIYDILVAFILVGVILKRLF